MTRREELIAKLADTMDPDGARAFVDEVIAEARAQDAALRVPPANEDLGAAFHAHLDVCAHCEAHPFDLCPEGMRLIREYQMEANQ